MRQDANDTQLYLAFDLIRQEVAMATVETCVNYIRIWMKQNKLKLNEDQTELIVIAPTSQAHKVTIETISIGDSEVKARTAKNNQGKLRQGEPRT